MIEEETERVNHTNIGTSEKVQEVLKSYGSTPLNFGNYTCRTDQTSGIVL